jgi:Uma2 family endonuclease
MEPPTTLRPLSYEAYAQIPHDGRRYEFLDGEVYVTPAPSPRHQYAVQRLFTALDSHFATQDTPLLVFVAPIDVILADDEIVQPDIVVARPPQVSERGIEGAPHMVVEVISPARRSLDRDVKARRYAAHGVTHYWIVDPTAETVECLQLVEGRYRVQASITHAGTLVVHAFPGLAVEVGALWLRTGSR